VTGLFSFVIPAEAGIQLSLLEEGSWTPAFAGVTDLGAGRNAPASMTNEIANA